MSQSLPERPNLEQFRKRARELQRESGKPLHEAQLAMARRYGFASWARLRRHVETIEVRTWTYTPRADEAPADRVLRLACVSYDEPTLDIVAANRLFARTPGLLDQDIAVATVFGEPAAVSRLLADGVASDAPTGPFGWTPLMYLAYSRVDVGEAATLAVARLLLDAGADPDEGRYFRGYPTPFTVLTGVFGGGESAPPPHPHAHALAGLLLDAGADPNDAQTLYNRQFGTDDSFLDVLFAHGLGTGDGGVWRERLPDLTPAPDELIRGLLAWAVVHDQRERVALMMRHGVDVVSPLPGGDGRTPSAVALANGHRELAALLPPAFPAGDRPAAAQPVTSGETAVAAFVGAALAGDADAVAAAAPDVVAAARAARPGLVVWAAAVGHGDAVGLLVDAGWDVDALARGDVPVEQPWQTALHTAVERDDAVALTRLLQLGARRDLRDARFDATPAEWARHFGHDQLLALLDG